MSEPRLRQEPTVRVEGEVGGVPYALVHGDCLLWMAQREPDSIHAIVTDPPFAVRDYSETEQAKRRAGQGGMWRQPPSLDGCRRSPLPRFTVLSVEERVELVAFFSQFASAALRVLVPGGHIFVAANPLLSDQVFAAIVKAGFEKRGQVIRLVQTLRGGDRPKGAESEFADTTVMPRSAHEPWGVFRKPFHGSVAGNLRRWGTGALRRISDAQPFCDVIRSAPTRKSERALSPHPSLKPQAFTRQIVRAALPLGRGIVLDPFMGGGSTIAAASALGYRSIGVERDASFFAIAVDGIPRLAALRLPA